MLFSRFVFDLEALWASSVKPLFCSGLSDKYLVNGHIFKHILLVTLLFHLCIVCCYWIKISIKLLSQMEVQGT